MQHIAIMRKSWGLTEKILSGEKKIESRWYFKKCQPWGKIKAGEVIYFKNSGESVKLKAEAERVIQFCDLTQLKVKEILNKYGRADGIEENKIPEFYARFKDKKYCILIFLKNPIRVVPFDINKSGFGAMAAWISIKNVLKIKK